MNKSLYGRAADALRGMASVSSLLIELEAADRLEVRKTTQVPGNYSAIKALKQLEAMFARLRCGSLTLEMEERAMILMSLNYVMDTICFLENLRTNKGQNTNENVRPLDR